MDKKYFWKNFNLGTELRLSGNFIYNGLKTFNDMHNLDYEEEIFEFLYNIAVGIERLEKILIILIEHNNTSNQKEFENSLKNHNHLYLLNRIRKKYSLKLHDVHIEFIELLSKFYKIFRYDRYKLEEVSVYDKEKQAIQDYISKHLGIKFEYIVPPKGKEINVFIGTIIGKIASELFKTIEQEASQNNLYTYEMRIDSKADKIFNRKEFDFSKETILSKELLIFLMNTKKSSDLIKFIKELEPLDFDIGLVAEYIGCFQSDERKLEHMDELDSIYDALNNKKERLEFLDAIDDTGFYFEFRDNMDNSDQVF